MLDQWLEQCGVSFRKASLIRDKKKRERARTASLSAHLSSGA